MAMYGPDILGGQKKLLDPLGLELQTCGYW